MTDLEKEKEFISNTLEDSEFISDSAFMIAYERDLESRRPDALFQDHLAVAIAGSKGERLSNEFEANHVAFGLWPSFHKQWTAVRTKFIDDQLCEKLAPSVPSPIAQFVNLGAGVCTRAFRLPCLASVVVVEVDLPKINQYKENFFALSERLNQKPLCKTRLIVSADLKAKMSLLQPLSALQHQFDVDLPSLFLAEGLIMYLGESWPNFIESVSKVAAPGSFFVVNVMLHPGCTQERLESNLKENGWIDVRFFTFGDSVLNYGRFEQGFQPCPAFSFFTCKKASK